MAEKKKKIPYKDWSQEEKDAYQQTRKDNDAAKLNALNESFGLLLAELDSLETPERIIAMVQNIRSKVINGSTAQRTTYLSAIFGCEKPTIGTTVSYLYIGLRGPNGERLQEGETFKDFILRVGDGNIKYDDKSINQMCWYIEQKGHKVTNDKKNATVTLVSLKSE
jgi:hypothetical protein